MTDVAHDTTMTNAELSKMLWSARESIAMFADIVEARSGQPDEMNRALVGQIDAYRESRGWNADGFGDEPTFAKHRIEQAGSAHTLLDRLDFAADDGFTVISVFYVPDDDFPWKAAIRVE